MSNSTEKDKKSKNNYIFKITLSLLVIIIAILRLVWYNEIGNRIDQTFISLIILSLLIMFVPWEKIEKFTLPGVGEFVFKPDSPEINNLLAKRAIDESKRVENLEIRDILHRKADIIEKIKGSRILWIDDDPRKLFEERRLFRAMNIETEILSSSENAQDLIQINNDFDLIITDASRRYGSFHNKIEPEGLPKLDGINFIKFIQTQWDDPIIANLPTIFYSHHTPENIQSYFEDVKLETKNVKHARGIIDLLELVIDTLDHARKEPLAIDPKRLEEKGSTPAYSRRD